MGVGLGEQLATGGRSAVFAWGRNAVAKVPFAATPDAQIHFEALYTAAIHDAGHRHRGIPVVYVQQDGAEGSDHAPDTPGWQLDPRVRHGGSDIVVRKAATDGFYPTDLEKRSATSAFTRW